MTTDTPQPNPNGERLLYWIGRACRQAREAQGVHMTAVAAMLRRNQPAVRSFEGGQNYPREGVDHMLAVYAHLCGIEDPRDLVRDALALWHEHGSAPRLSRADAEVGANPGAAVSPPPTLAPRSEKTSARQTRRAARQ